MPYQWARYIFYYRLLSLGTMVVAFWPKFLNCHAIARTCGLNVPRLSRICGLRCRGGSQKAKNIAVYETAKVAVTAKPKGLLTTL